MLIPTPEREMWTGCAPSPDREALKDTLAQVRQAALQEQVRSGVHAAPRPGSAQRLTQVALRVPQVMEHGSAAALRKHQQELAALQAAAAAEQARQRRPVDVKEQLIDQLVHEVRQSAREWARGRRPVGNVTAGAMRPLHPPPQVEERTDFLEAMTAAGRGAQYEAQVKAEIQQRLAALKAHGVDVPGPAGGAGARGARRAAARAPWQRKDEEI